MLTLGVLIAACGSAEPQHVETPQSEANATASDMCTVRISVVMPPNALVFWDDVPMMNPATVTTKKDGTSHRLTVRARGYATVSDRVIANAPNVEVKMNLTPTDPI
jgi:hypothetical protein